MYQPILKRLEARTTWRPRLLRIYLIRIPMTQLTRLTEPTAGLEAPSLSKVVRALSTLGLPLEGPANAVCVEIDPYLSV